MADRFIPSIHSALRAQKVVEPFDLLVKGDNSSWDWTRRCSTQQSRADLFAILKTAYEQAYFQGRPMGAQELQKTVLGPAAANHWLDDRQGDQGVVAVESVDEGGASKLAVHFTVNRIGAQIPACRGTSIRVSEQASIMT